jgi:hypothetical protein
VTPVTGATTNAESWEEIGWIALDSATVAFGAASVLGEDFRLEWESGIGDGSPRGYEAVLVLQCGFRAIPYTRSDRIRTPIPTFSYTR